MRVEHLEVFYYVCRAGGFNQATRLMPYTVGQPTLSAHIKSLEEQTGLTLFTRPRGGSVALTAAGRKLYGEIAPFFDKLDATRREKAGHHGPELRIGASQFVLQEYLLPFIALLEGAFPTVRLTLRQGSVDQLEGALRADEIDLAIAAVDQPFAGFSSHRLMSLAPVLLVPVTSRITDANTLLAQNPIAERLICPPADEGVSKIFERELRARGIQWPCAIRAASTALVPHMVGGRKCAGLCLGVNRLTKCPGIRSLPLDGFAALTLVAQWSPKNSPTLNRFLELIQAAAPKVASTIAA